MTYPIPEKPVLLPLPVQMAADRLFAFTTTRQGGVSQGAYESLNLSITSADNPDNVLANRQIVAVMLNTDTSRMIFMQQQHTANVKVIDASYFSLNESDQTNFLASTDGMVTNMPGIYLCALSADCAGVVVWDARRHALGVAHAGWRGVVNGIVLNLLTDMKDNYGTRAEDCQVSVGPCISFGNYEVGKDLASDFLKRFKSTKVAACKEGKWYISIADSIHQQLTSAGIPAGNVHLPGYCTFRDNSLFFSARRGNKGRFAVMASLR